MSDSHGFTPSRKVRSAGCFLRPWGFPTTVVQPRIVLSVWDHAVVLAFAVALPVYARYNYPRFKRAVESGDGEARSRQYQKTTLRQWVLASVAALVWFRAGRTAEELGLGVAFGLRFWIALGAAAALAFVWRQLFLAAMNDEAGRASLVAQLRTLQPLLPSTARELRLFIALSITAGICEELLFRGYLIGYLTFVIGFPAACVLSGVLFGVGHLYQGPRQAAKIIVLGLVFVAFYVGSGSLWIPMALHALLDAAQGRLAFRLLKSEEKVRGQQE